MAAEASTRRIYDAEVGPPIGDQLAQPDADSNGVHERGPVLRVLGAKNSDFRQLTAYCSALDLVSGDLDAVVETCGYVLWE